MIEATGHWTTTDVGFIKNSSLVFNRFQPHFRQDFPEYIIPKEDFIMNNNEKSVKKGRRSRIRTKEEVIKDIKFLVKKNPKFLNHKYLRKNGPGNLVYAACKHFGTWNKAILASGEKPLTEKWSKERVIKEIKTIYKETGNVPNLGIFRRSKKSRLPNAVNRYFGSWGAAIRAAGLKPLRNNHWTKKDLIKELKNIVQEIGHTPSKRELKRLKRDDLVSSGSKVFKRYNNYLIASGFEPVLVPNIWSKENIKQELIRISKEIGRTPTERDMIPLGKRTLIMASLRQFKGWNNAIKYAGLIPNESCVKDKIWKRWEQLALEICESSVPNSKKHKQLPNKTFPDFYNPSDRLIVEVKINASDSTLHQDIANYEPYCDRMEIWYLKGKPITARSEKVTFKGPKEIISQIKYNKEWLTRLNEMLNEIKNGDKKD